MGGGRGGVRIPNYRSNFTELPKYRKNLNHHHRNFLYKLAKTLQIPDYREKIHPLPFTERKITQIPSPLKYQLPNYRNFFWEITDYRPKKRANTVSPKTPRPPPI